MAPGDTNVGSTPNRALPLLDTLYHQTLKYVLGASAPFKMISIDLHHLTLLIERENECRAVWLAPVRCDVGNGDDCFYS